MLLRVICVERRVALFTFLSSYTADPPASAYSPIQSKPPNTRAMATPDAAAAAPSSVMSLPLPPAQYISLFSDENVRKNRQPRPPPAIPDAYSMFGNTYNNEEMIRSLESQGFRRLIPQHFDRRKELKKLNHSLFANFLDLIDLLVNYPDSPRRAEKIDDLSLLFVHIHHLLNEFRPHQARETLRVVMEMQKRARVETRRRFQRHLEMVRDLVKGAFNALPDEHQQQLAEKQLLASMTNGGGAGVDNIKLEPGTVAASAAMTAADWRTDTCDPLDRLMCELVDEEMA